MKAAFITPPVKTSVICYHCGEPCSDHAVRFDGKNFCCNGCKSVYEILQHNSMCDYYDLQQHPGIKSSESDGSSYDFLKEETIVDQLLTFREGSICRVSFYIPGIHCSSCIWLLENLNKVQAGIIFTSVSFQKKTMEIQFDSRKVSLAQLALLLDRLGYKPEITLQGKVINNQSRDKALLYKIGVAGFCFGNIMLLSMPEYVSFFDDFNGSFKLFFGYISLVLALPTFFYSASGYFISSWNVIRHRIITIDLPIAMGLLAAFVQSAFEILSKTGIGYLDSLTGLIFFLLIGKWYQQKTFTAISFQRDYKSFFPLAATAVRQGKQVFVALKELKAGEIILLKNHDIIPADGILLKGDAKIDYSFVTGEASLISKHQGELLYAGGRNSGASIQMKLTKKVSESYLVQLWNTDRTSKETVSAFEHFTNRIGVYFTVAVLLLGIATYLYWYSQHSPAALHAAISVLIIFCPCTLALAIPFCFGNAMNILSKNGFFLKNTSTIERLAEAQDVVFDKTGTLTFAGESDMKFEGTLTEEEEEYVYSLVSQSSHPLSRLVSGYLNKNHAYPVTAFEEKLSRGISGVINGKYLRVGAASFTGAVGSSSETEVHVNIDGELKGRFIAKNRYRKNVLDMLVGLYHKYRLHLLSGDNETEKETMQHYFPPGNILFRQLPEDKLDYVLQLEKPRRTIMVGDGLNDAGALQASNCGIAVSDSNLNFTPASNAVLNSDKLDKLQDFLSYSKACVRTVRWSLAISLSYNVVGLYFACQGLLKPLVAAVLMPVSSVSVVLFVTVASNLLAKKYGLAQN